jgi:hypothetical protein
MTFMPELFDPQQSLATEDQHYPGLAILVIHFLPFYVE